MWIDSLLWFLLSLTAIIDWRCRRIPNSLLFIGLLLLLFKLFLFHPTPWWWGAMGLAVASLVGLPVYFFGWFGAGDVKLIMLLGTWLGPVDLCYGVLYSMVMGGFLALWIKKYRPQLGVPYGVAIALGFAFEQGLKSVI